MDEFCITEGKSATSGLQYGGFSIPTEYLLHIKHYRDKLRKIFREETTRNGAIRAEKLVQYVSLPITQYLSCFTNTAELIRG